MVWNAVINVIWRGKKNHVIILLKGGMSNDLFHESKGLAGRELLDELLKSNRHYITQYD